MEKNIFSALMPILITYVELIIKKGHVTQSIDNSLAHRCVFGQQWSSVGQKSEICQALKTHI